MQGKRDTLLDRKNKLNNSLGISGGSDVFGDSFFTRPFGTMFESPIFGLTFSSSDSLQTNGGQNLVIEELESDDEVEKNENIGGAQKKLRHYTKDKEPSVEHPDDENEERRTSTTTHNVYKTLERMQPHMQAKTRSFSSRSCKVTYGGINGPYYTSTRSQKMGNDGVVIDETKEADRTTGQATHKVARCINDKVHSVTRKLKSDGMVDVMQTLHNLTEDDLAGFEQSWKDKNHMPSWSNEYGMSGGTDHSSRQYKRDVGWSGQALPSVINIGSGSSSTGWAKKVVRINID